MVSFVLDLSSAPIPPELFLLVIKESVPCTSSPPFPSFPAQNLFGPWTVWAKNETSLCLPTCFSLAQPLPPQRTWGKDRPQVGSEHRKARTPRKQINPSDPKPEHKNSCLHLSCSSPSGESHGPLHPQPTKREGLVGRENTLNTSFILYSIVQFFKVNVHGFCLLSIQFP